MGTRNKEIIKECNKYCKGISEKIDNYISNNTIAPALVKKLHKENKYLLKEALTFITHIHESIEGSDLMAILTDKDGNILHISDFTHEDNNLTDNILPGLSMNINDMGCNAFGLAIENNIEMQVSRDEHYAPALKTYCSTAANIHSGDGDVIGCFGFISRRELAHIHTLGLAISTAKAIENHLTHKDVSARLDAANHYTFAIMNSLKFGVIAVNLLGEIQYANNFACQALNIRRKELMRIPISNLIQGWEGIAGQIVNNEKFLNEETILTIRKRKEKFNLSVFPIYDEKNNLIGMVNSIRDMEKVYQMINKYTGGNARFSFDDIIAQSKSMKSIISFCKKVANSPSTVLIEGDSGTGKEVLAQAIHNYSSRKDSGFVAINCAAIAETLIESELFGYDEGAFTDAKKGGRPGKFELANGGTLFLDEIGDMKPDMQVKLLRAIQEGTITRVGGDKVIPVDVRIIAATNKNLKDEVENGNFRLDLYYRLNVIPVSIPPLRDRKEDIPSLIKHFLNKKAKQLRKNKPNLKYRTLQDLLEYDWPGNIRELENHIEKIVNFNGDYPLAKKSIEEKQDLFVSNTSGASAGYITFTLDEMERKTIVRTLKLMNGNISKTAKTLGIGRNTLYTKLKKYKIVIN